LTLQKFELTHDVFFLVGDSVASEFYVLMFLLHTTYDGTDSVLKCGHIKLRRQGITQKKEYNIHSTAKI
jgi:hypothetical protein